jgi:UDP-N-acetylglucosamine 2-epimerase (non-hydrolysing)
MPEEINRLLTDSISDLLFVTEQSGMDNLKSEGVPAGKMHFVGNVMIDTLLANREKAEKSDILKKLNLESKKYAVITLHRPSNVDDMNNLEKIISAFEVIQKDLKLVFPIHPRTRKNIENTDFKTRVAAMENLILLEPVGYLDFLKLTANAALVLTDSGGIQEETTILQVPCMTLRENTERPVTVTEGTNRLVHIETADILKHYNEIKYAGFKTKGRIPKFWDGKAAERITEIIQQDTTLK